VNSDPVKLKRSVFLARLRRVWKLEAVFPSKLVGSSRCGFKLTWILRWCTVYIDGRALISICTCASVSPAHSLALLPLCISSQYSRFSRAIRGKIAPPFLVFILSFNSQSILSFELFCVLFLRDGGAGDGGRCSNGAVERPLVQKCSLVLVGKHPLVSVSQPRPPIRD